MARKKAQVQQLQIQQIEGQLTLWDVMGTTKNEKPSAVESKVLTADKASSPIQGIIEKYRMNPGLNRIIKYCGGGMGIELQEGAGYKTIYVNKNGAEEFEYGKKSAVLPMDEIVYYKRSESTNDIQEDKLQKLKGTTRVKEVVRRKGDENILVVTDGKVISINREGWVLEFNGVQAVFEVDEVVKDLPEEESESMEDIQKAVKEGDAIEAKYGDKTIRGRICRIYGMGMALNVIFDNGTKHTAINRKSVTKLVKSA